MFCSIPGSNIKFVNKAVEALSKLSDEVHIECQDDSMVLSTYNALKTAYAKYAFDTNFFLQYEYKKAPNITMACKLSNRSLQMIFKKKMEKKIETCKIQLDDAENHIVFHLKYKSGITTIHNFLLINWEESSWVLDADSNSNKLVCKSSLLLNVLNNFKRKDVQIFIDASEDSFILRNYAKEGRNFKTVHSQVKLDKGEFLSYNVHSKCSFMMSVRALRSVISYADSLSVHLLISFTKGGSPFIVRIERESCSGCCVISTLPLDGSVVDGLLPISANTSFVSVQRNMESVNSDVDMQCQSLAVQGTDIPVDFLMDDDFAMAEPNETVTKKPGIKSSIRHIFDRCYEPTFRESQLNLGTVICLNSGSESD